MEALLTKLAADSPAIGAIIGVTALGLLDWLLGILRAISGKTFDLAYLDVWVRVQLMGRILPIVLVLAFSQAIGNITVGPVELNLLFAGGIAAAGAYALTTLKSIVGSLNANTPDLLPKE